MGWERTKANFAVAIETMGGRPGFSVEEPLEPVVGKKQYEVIDRIAAVAKSRKLGFLGGFGITTLGTRIKITRGGEGEPQFLVKEKGRSTSEPSTREAELEAIRRHLNRSSANGSSRRRSRLLRV